MGIEKLAFLQARPGRADELRDALSELESLTRLEPGCVAFSFYQALSDPASFVLLEQFVSQAAFDDHLQQAHTLAFFKQDLVARAQVRPLSPEPAPP